MPVLTTAIISVFSRADIRVLFLKKLPYHCNVKPSHTIFILEVLNENTNTNIIGIRIPDNKITHSLTKDFPITSTSANLSNIQTPDNITDIKKQLGDNIDIYIDCGKKIKNQPSTIIDLTQQNPKIIRQHKNNELINKILKIDLY